MFLFLTFLLVFVDVHLSLLLEPQRVDDGNGQSQGFPGVTVGTQGVDASACRRDVVCVVDREIKMGSEKRHRRTEILSQRYAFFFLFHSLSY